MTVTWRAIVASIGAHALVLTALVQAPPRPGPASEPTKPLEVSVVTPIEPAPAAAGGAAGPPARPARAVASSGSPRRTAPRPEPEPAPAAPSVGPALLGMRSKSSEVRVPRASEVVGKPEGPPPVDQLPPGALGGPIPSRSRPENPLGPNMVPDGSGGYREEHITFNANVERDGTIHFKDKGSSGVDEVLPYPIAIVVTGHFDLTEELMRLHGEDPYRYEKTKIMERTRDERAGMAATARSERLHEAVRKMPAYLDKVWGYTAWSAAERRAALFALWEEVAEDGADEVVSIGRMVRATIVGFIRRRLPAGSADAFTRAEIEALNRRRTCKARFEPYP
jgi:hypothetical protein